MNNLIPKVAVFVFASITAIYITFGLFTGGNALGNLYRFLAIAAVIIAVIAPRASVWLLLLETAYLDFLKRLMTVAGNPDWLDITLVLAIAPMTSVGILVGVLVQYILGSLSLNRYHATLLGISLAIFLFNFALIAADGLDLAVLRDLANRGGYVFLLFSIPALFRSVEEIKSLISGIFVIYIPVLGYLFYQSAVGLTDWEYKYLMSGYSLEIRQFRNAVFRPFSTLNAAANLSTMMSVMVALAFAPHKIKFLSLPFVRVIMAGLFIFGAYLTLSRGGWFCGITAIACILLFRTAWTTIAAYVSGFALIGIVILSADWMIRNDILSQATEAIGDYGSGDRYTMATRLGTFDARLQSYRELLNNKQYWTPFGVVISGKAAYRDLRSTDFDDEYYSHDFITETLLLIGYIPMALLIISLSISMFKLHRYLLGLSDGVVERVTRYCVAVAVGIAIGAVANPAQLQTFPISTFFWLFIAMSAAIRPQSANVPEEDPVFVGGISTDGVPDTRYA